MHFKIKDLHDQIVHILTKTILFASLLLFWRKIVTKVVWLYVEWGWDNGKQIILLCYNSLLQI